MKRWPKICMGIGVGILFAVSYGFIDPHLSFSQSALYQYIQSLLVSLVYRHTYIAASIYVMALVGMYISYGKLMVENYRIKLNTILGFFIGVVGVLLLSYPALSYDIFNYIATAKVTFQYQENPYVIMPIEIPNEPMLSYTRAANKLALYGPTWIVLTSFPHILSSGNPLAAIISFKLLATLFYLMFVYMIYRKTKRWNQAMWFAFNPLVLIEVIMNGHNDIVMMVLAIGGLLMWQRERQVYKGIGIVLWVSSIFIKGATIVLLPLFFFSPKDREKSMKIGFWCMFGVFLLSPLREEMYSWYAVWWLSFAAFISIQKQPFVHGFSYWLSFGLMLRYIPWIATREYGGITPISRIVLTLVPLCIYIILSRKRISHVFSSWRKSL